MSFPFLWIGAIVAGLLLSAVMTLFGFALHLVARVTNEVRGSILPGLVSGFREWADGYLAAPRGTSSRHGSSPEPPFEEVPLRDKPVRTRLRARVH
jgi:hypothetical protein